MPRVKTICDICCNKVIETESNTEDALFCEGVCQKWVHQNCAGVTRYYFEKLSKSDGPWYLSAVEDWFLLVYARRSCTIEVQIEY